MCFISRSFGLIFQNSQCDHEVARLFDSIRPSGGTPLGYALDKCIRSYIKNWKSANGGIWSRLTSQRSPKPRNFLVITDGCPSTYPYSIPLYSHLLTSFQPMIPRTSSSGSHLKWTSSRCHKTKSGSSLCRSEMTLKQQSSSKILMTMFLQAQSSDPVHNPTVI